MVWTVASGRLLEQDVLPSLLCVVMGCWLVRGGVREKEDERTHDFCAEERSVSLRDLWAEPGRVHGVCARGALATAASSGLSAKEEKGRSRSERKSDEEEETACAAHSPPQHFPARDLVHHRSLVPSWRSSEMPAWPCPRCYFMNCLQTLQNIRRHSHRQTLTPSHSFHSSPRLMSPTDQNTVQRHTSEAIKIASRKKQTTKANTHSDPVQNVDASDASHDTTPRSSSGRPILPSGFSSDHLASSSGWIYTSVGFVPSTTTHKSALQAAQL